MKRSLLLLLVVLALALAACGVDGTGDQVTASFRLVGAEGEEILAYTEPAPAGSSAADYILAACQSAKLAYTFSDGYFDNFNGVASGTEKGWLFYVDDAIAQLGAAEIELTEGLRLEFRYTSFAEAFPEFY